jgi:hypothetical protein
VLPQLVDIVVEISPVHYPRGRDDLAELLARYTAAGFQALRAPNGYSVPEQHRSVAEPPRPL